MRKPRKTWTIEELDYLKMEYNPYKVEEIAKILERPVSSIKRKVDSMKVREKQNWTKEEVHYLTEKLGTLDYNTIAKNLGRTAIAVRVKAQKLGLGDPSTLFDGLTVNQLSVILKIHYSIVISWIEKYDLPMVYKVFAFKEVKCIKIDEFWEWAEKHKTFFSLANVEENVLAPEPEWAKVKRGADKLAYDKMKPKGPWSKEEDMILHSMLKARCYTYQEIAQRLQRTEAAIRRRRYDLYIDISPKRNPDRKWTAKEINIAINMCKDGYGLNTIGEKLGRSASAVRGKLEAKGYGFDRGVIYKRDNIEKIVL